MAVDPRLLDYIRRQINAGFRKQQIYDVLLQTGWYRDEVDAAFYIVVREMSTPTQQAAPRPPQARPEVPQSPGFFWKLGSSVAHPGRLFVAVRNEKVTEVLRNGLVCPLADHDVFCIFHRRDFLELP
jgi:hypothetical protein